MKKKEIAGGILAIIGIAIIFSCLGNLKVGLAVLDNTITILCGMSLMVSGAVISDFFEED